MMSDINYWLIFFSAAFALNIAPGPDLIYIITKTITNGKIVGLAAALGVCTGALFHVIVASVGLSAIIVASALAFTIVKLVGAAYLIYLAYQAFQSTGPDLTDLPPPTGIKNKSSAWLAFRQGVLIDILNTKVAIFFMAFLPQFVRDGAEYGSMSVQLFYLGLLVIFVAIIVEYLYVLAASKLTRQLNNKTTSRWLNRIVGIVFIGLSIKLAVSSSN